MKLSYKSVSVILSAIVLIGGFLSDALAKLPDNTSLSVGVLTVAGALLAGAVPLLHNAHAVKIAQLFGAVISEALAAQQSTATPDPAPADPVTPVTPVVDVAAVVAQFQAKQAEANALLAQLTAGQSA